MREKAIIVGLTVALLSSASDALDPLGPPKALLSKGHWGLGIEYAYSESETDLTDVVFGGTALPDGCGRLRENEAYASLRYGVCENVDVFARLGVMAAEMQLMVDGDAGLAWGLGAAATLYDTDKLDWGLLVQFSRGESSEHPMHPLYPNESGETEIWSLQVAGGPTYQLREDLAVYGGVFCDMLRGEFEGVGSHFDIEEDDPFGGFAGLDWMVKEHAHMTMEFQYAGTTLAIATGLRWAFE